MQKVQNKLILWKVKMKYKKTWEDNYPMHSQANGHCLCSNIAG